MKIETPAGKDQDLSKVADLPDVPGPDTAGKAPDQRPSVDVAIEVLGHLAERAEPLLGRLRSWDLRGLDSKMSVAFQGSVDDVQNAFRRLSDQLLALQAIGFVAKTTPTTRLRASLHVGKQVKLTTNARSELSQVYTTEQLDSLRIDKILPKHVVLSASDGTSIGMVKLAFIDE
jgi:hypothetical protein